MTAPATASEPTIDDHVANLLFREAHTAYAFTDAPVSQERLATIYDLTRHAPTMMNSQPLRIVFVRSDEAKARLLPHLAEGNRVKSTSAPVVAILAADTDFHDHLARVHPQRPGARDLFSDDAAREKAARFNAALQAGYFILAVRAVGLDAGPMGGLDAVGIDAEFFAGSGLRTLMAVNIGTAAPDGQLPRNPRLEFDEAVTVL